MPGDKVTMVKDNTSGRIVSLPHSVKYGDIGVTIEIRGNYSVSHAHIYIIPLKQKWPLKPIFEKASRVQEHF